MLRGRILGVSLDFLDLQCVPESMLAQHDQPLITVEIPKRDVRKEVIAKVSLGLRRELDGSGPSLSQL